VSETVLVAPKFDSATEYRRKGNNWTQEEIEMLKSVFIGTPKKLLEQLFPRHTYESTRKKAVKLGLNHGIDKHWTPEEDELLRRMYPSYSREKVLNGIPRHTWKAIRARAENIIHVKRLIAPLWMEPSKTKLIGGEATDFELGFAVGLFEGEGWITLHHSRKRKTPPRASIGIGNTNLELLKKAQGIIGGSISENSCSGKKAMYHLVISKHKAVLETLRILKPQLIEKREKAEEVLKYLESLSNMPRWKS
jgi:hypothetical protein